MTAAPPGEPRITQPVTCACLHPVCSPRLSTWRPWFCSGCATDFHPGPAPWRENAERNECGSPGCLKYGCTCGAVALSSSLSPFPLPFSSSSAAVASSVFARQDAPASCLGACSCGAGGGLPAAVRTRAGGRVQVQVQHQPEGAASV